MRATILCLLLATLTSAQIVAQIPPGMVQIDDMILPESVLTGDGAFVATPWPAGQVPYEFHANVSAANRTAMLAAMAEIEAVCLVDFFPRGSEPNYLVVMSSNQNSSAVGMIGGAQIVRIIDWGTRHILVHELLHALGHIHEHQRVDRDSFVSIQSNNVSSTCGTGNNESCLHNFNRIDTGAVVGAYDFLSLMHYGGNAFSSNGQPTIQCLPNYASFQTQMGQRQYLSVQDAFALQARYFFQNPPSTGLLSPTQVSPGSIGFTLNVYGNRFLAGSLTPGVGVQGSRVLWNGVPLTTTFVDSTQLQAFVPSSLIVGPGQFTIQVENPYPGGGISWDSKTFLVGCSSLPPLVLSPGTVLGTSASCQGLSVTPASTWSVIAAAGANSDWNLGMGSATSASSGTSTEIVAANGMRWGTSPSFYQQPGALSLTYGTLPGTIEMVSSTNLSLGQAVFGTLPPGALARAYHFTGGPGLIRVESYGSHNLRWAILSDVYSTPAWRSRTSDQVAVGIVGFPPTSGISVPAGFFGPNDYCLVVFHEGGPATTSSSYNITVCLDTNAMSLGQTATNINGTVGLCLPYSITPHANQWNAVGVSSASDYDISIDNITSAISGSECDYLISNGNFQQTVSTSGTINRYAGFQAADAMHAATTTAPLPGSTAATTSLLHVFEMTPNLAGNYDIAITAPAGFTWDFHEAGTSSAWRIRGSRNGGPYPANGLPVRIQMGGGVHAIVVSRAGGAAPGGPASIQFQSALSSLQPPAPTGLSPSLMPALSPTFALTVTGDHFSPTSVVRWEGAPVPTTFVSPTEIVATIDASLLLLPRSLYVDVHDPASGTSGPLFFVVGNPIPVITSLSPFRALAGSPGQNVVITGVGFLPTTVIKNDGVTLYSAFVSDTEIQAVIPAPMLAANGVSFITAANAFSPASQPSPFLIDGPFLWSVAPDQIPVGSAAPLLLTVTGANFVPGAQAFADNIPLPTTYIDEFQLEAMLDPSLFAATSALGGLGINVGNTLTAISNPRWIAIGSGENRGAIRLDPIDAAPGALAHLFFEEYEGLFGQPVSMIVDLGNPTPLGNWPNPTSNMVLGVTVGSVGPILPLRDGLGLLGPPDGSVLGPLVYGGYISSPPILLPSPPLGITAFVQVAYIDPTSPIGFRLSWTRQVGL